jgi:O-methyltransferase domain
VIWPQEAPEALANGRVTFMEHDFFQPNPVKDAEVYWLRYVLYVTPYQTDFLLTQRLTIACRHDWSDEYCIKILTGIRTSMSSAKSRVLICDQVMNTTLGSTELLSAPAPLPANYGYYTRYSHQRDLCMMGIINGIERTPMEFKDLVEKAGFKIEKIWECRSQVSIVELRLNTVLNGDKYDSVTGTDGVNGKNGLH